MSLPRKHSKVSGPHSTSSQTTYEDDQYDLNEGGIRRHKPTLNECKAKTNDDSLNTSISSFSEEIFNNAMNFLTEEDYEIEKVTKRTSLYSPINLFT
jgi:hypothetical protein